MSNLRTLPPLTVLAILLAGPTSQAEEQLQLLPTRDVDITYDVTRPEQSKKIRERVRWLAGEHLERIDGPDRSTTILNHSTNEITLLTPARRTYSKLDGGPRQPDPQLGAALKRGSEAIVAGQHCVDWSWTEDVETHTVCATADGVLLRLIVDGKTVKEARSVSYGRQRPEIFEVPPGYTPALAPDGTAEP